MTFEERIDALTARHEALTSRHEALAQSVELLLHAQTKNEEAQAKNEVLMAQVLDSILRLERIVFAHEGRISNLEGGER